MQTKPVMTLSDVKKIAAAAEAHALANQWKVSIAIVDDGGHLMHFARLDGAPASTCDIAPAKARMAAFTTKETKVHEDAINNGRTSFLSALTLGHVRGAALEGGVPIVVEGHTVGAVGVSGVKSEDDAAIAKAGIAAL